MTSGRGIDLAAAERGLRELGFSGVAAAMAGGRLVLDVALGESDRACGRPNTPATRFGLASATKLFTAVTIARLVERGATTFEARIVDLLSADERPRGLSPDVTIGHLLTHTSGIADYADEYAGQPYEAIWRDIPSYRMRRPADFLPLFRDLPALASPGAEARYSNAGFILLGIVVERLTGRPFTDVVTDEVFAPAGLRDTAWIALDEPVRDVAVGYLPGEDGAWRSNVFSIPALGGPDGGAYSTARDMLTFLRQLIDGPLLSPATRALVLTARVRDDREACWYGYGVQVHGEGISRMIGHPGEDPGFSARAFWYPALDAGLVVLSNVSEGSRTARRFLEPLLLAALDVPPR